MKTGNFVSNIICAVALTTVAGGMSYAAIQPEASSRHQDVLELKPVGYWPADEGEGTVLHDLSGNGNNGKLFNVPWRNGLLDFDGRYEWGAIPSHEVYQSQAISISGWAFTRNPAHKNCGSISIGNTINTYMPRADSATLFASTHAVSGNRGNAGADGGVTFEHTVKVMRRAYNPLRRQPDLNGKIDADEAKWSGWMELPAQFRQTVTIDGKPWALPRGGGGYVGSSSPSSAARRSS